MDHRQGDRQADRQGDRATGRQGDRQAGRQAERRGRERDGSLQREAAHRAVHAGKGASN